MTSSAGSADAAASNGVPDGVPNAVSDNASAPPERAAPRPASTSDGRQPAPVADRQRIHALDALRGFALCGIVFINVPQTLQMYSNPAGLPEVWRWIALERFYPIFCLLFGVGFGLFLRSAMRRTDRPRRLLVRRFAALGVLGGLLHLLQPSEVLLPFACAGVLVLLPLSYLRRSAVTLAIAIGLTLLGVAAGVGGFGVLPGLLALGFALASYDVPHTLPEWVRQLMTLVLVGAGCAVLGAWLATTVLADVAMAQRQLGMVISLGMSIGYLALFLLVLRTPVGPALSAVLAPMGRLALTNYVTQAVLFVSVGHAIGLMGSQRWATAATLCVGILLLQAGWSAVWLRNGFGYGPLEWAWRCVTYWRRLPLRTPRQGSPAR